MFATQPVTLSAIPQPLPVIDPSGEPMADGSFEAQFSALLASIDGRAPTAGPASTAAPAAPHGARGDRQQPATGNLPGKQDGNILPDGLAAAVLLPGEDEAAPALPDAPAPATAVPAAGLAPAGEPAPFAAPALSLVQPGSGAALAAPQAAPAVPVPVRPGAAHLLAAASTAPATTTTALPSARPIVPGASGQRGAVALPPRASEPAPLIRAASAEEPPGKPETVLSSLPLGIAPAAAATALALLPLPLRSAQVSPRVSAALTPLGDALAVALVAAQQRPASAEPAVPVDAPAAQSLAGPETLSASLAPLATGAASLVSPPPVSAPQAHDFAALIDRLVDARQAAQATLVSQTVQATFEHPEFGRLSLQFRQDPSGLTVAFANPDPDLARAVQTMATTTAFAGLGDTGTAHRQDGQGGGAALSGQTQGQAATQQQRGQAQHREPAFAAGAQNRQSDDAANSPSAPRDGIFA